MLHTSITNVYQFPKVHFKQMLSTRSKSNTFACPCKRTITAMAKIYYRKYVVVHINIIINYVIFELLERYLNVRLKSIRTDRPYPGMMHKDPKSVPSEFGGQMSRRSKKCATIRKHLCDIRH